MGGCTGTADQCWGQASLICYFPGLVVVSFNLESGGKGDTGLVSRGGNLLFPLRYCWSPCLLRVETLKADR